MCEGASTLSLLVVCQTGNINIAGMSSLCNEMLTALLALCEGKHRSPVDFLHKGSIMQYVDDFFDIGPNTLSHKAS